MADVTQFHPPPIPHSRRGTLPSFVATCPVKCVLILRGAEWVLAHSVHLLSCSGKWLQKSDFGPNFNNINLALSPMIMSKFYPEQSVDRQIHKYICIYLQTYERTYIYTYIHPYIHTHVRIDTTSERIALLCFVKVTVRGDWACC